MLMHKMYCQLHKRFQTPNLEDDFKRGREIFASVFEKQVKLFKENDELFDIWSVHPETAERVQRQWKDEDKWLVRNGETKASLKIRSIIEMVTSRLEISFYGAIDLGSAPGDVLENVLFPTVDKILPVVNKTAISLDLKPWQIEKYHKRCQMLAQHNALIKLDTNNSHGDALCRVCLSKVCDTFYVGLPKDSIYFPMLILSDVGRQISMTNKKDYMNGFAILENVLYMMIQLCRRGIKSHKIFAIVKVQTPLLEMAWASEHEVCRTLGSITRLCEENEWVCNFLKPCGSATFNQEVYALIMDKRRIKIGNLDLKDCMDLAWHMLSVRLNKVIYSRQALAQCISDHVEQENCMLVDEL